MIKFTEDKLKTSPAATWKDVAVGMTKYVLSDRTSWNWKKLQGDFRENHAITSKEEIGTKMSEDLLQLVSDKSNDIQEVVVEQLRKKQRN